MTSSVAASDPAHFALGYAAGADQVVIGMPSDQELIRFTRVGDVNLDDAVGFPDLLALAQHYGRSSARWDQGDLNYDGAVDFSDLLLLAKNYGATSAGVGVEVSGTFSAIPEPAIGFAVALLLARRRRRSLTSQAPKASTIQPLVVMPPFASSEHRINVAHLEAP